MKTKMHSQNWMMSFPDDVIPEGKRNTTLSRFAGRLIVKYDDTEETHMRFLEEAKKCGALAEPIYIMGYSLKEFVCGNEKQEKILKKLGHNYEYPEVRMPKEKREFILDLFKNQEISQNQQLDYTSHEYQKIKE